MIKQKASLLSKWSQRAVLVTSALVLAFLLPASGAHAQSLDEQIKEFEAKIQLDQNNIAKLRAEANTLQNAINAINLEKSTLQTQINLNTAKMEQINSQILDNERKLQEQKLSLGANLRSMYLESSVTPLEMVASSKNISDFIDRQEYRTKIRDKVQENMGNIRTIKEDLAKQKIALDQTLKDQNAQREVLVAKEAEQARLLDETQGQEAAYQESVKANLTEKKKLEDQRRAANLKGGLAKFQPRGGGYPHYWADPPMDSMLDNWGMYNRECVSYTAFKVHASGRHMPYWGGIGNANQWDDNARRAGIPVDGNPRAGDVAVWHNGVYGHVMYVEAVLGDGSIFISEYNYDVTGRYSERTLSKAEYRAQGLVFIHF